MVANAVMLTSHHNQCVTLLLNLDENADLLAELQQREGRSGGS